MRRKEKEITDRNEIDAIIRKSLVCRLGLADHNRPYVVPLCFGYSDNALYFHSAGEGKKLDMIKNNPHVCFEFDIDQKLVEAEDACKWGMYFRSVIGYGKASLLDDLDSKRRAYDIIMKQYSDKKWEYKEAVVGTSCIIRVDIEEITGKKSGY